METILERQRNAHEDIERTEHAITERLMAHPRTIRDRLQFDHEIAEMLERIGLRAHSLKELYADPLATRTKEIAALSAAGGLDNFYDHLSEIKDFHKRYPDERVENLAREYEITLPDPNVPLDTEDQISKMFSGEEALGRYFDLIALHSAFVNLKRNRTLTYLKYLDTFNSFDATTFPAYVKQDPKYLVYLQNLEDYLISFYKRSTPLDEHEEVLKTLLEGFESEWKAAQNEPTGIWCDICQKMYSKQTVYDGHLNSKKHQAGLSSNEVSNLSTKPQQNQSEHQKDIARREFMISKLALKFNNVKTATKANVARKQTLTDKEWQAEQESSNDVSLMPAPVNANGTMGTDEDDENDPEKIYNPLKLPLGWDGKPIPFWLWRLHGLGVEYPCEICGNYVYMGRKAFDRHFLEWRHVHGLRCLGISGNSGLFDQITLIADAIGLSERLESQRRQEEKRRDEGVEMEDEGGNVMSAKVYNDLVAQGIL